MPGMAIYTFYVDAKIKIDELLEMLAEAGCDAASEHGQDCAAVRLYSKSGIYKDIAIGGTDEEQEMASKVLDERARTSLN